MEESKEENGDIRFTHQLSRVTTSFFTDDSLFFFKTESHECDELMKLVRVYEKVSGQCISFEKISLLFGRVSTNVQKMIKTSLSIDYEEEMGSYLGIPMDISGSKCKSFAFLKDNG